MPAFSKRSVSSLSTCDPRLVRLFEQVLAYGFDCVVAEGHRPKHIQDAHFQAKLSKVQWPNSKHNAFPSKAADVYPYVNGRMVNGDKPGDMEQFALFAGAVLAVAASMGLKLRWGGDFNQNLNLTDDRWDDMPHFELEE
jgi:peptidoglycan L-alanyl-D-glutamate endopeptidase CwlK